MVMAGTSREQEREKTPAPTGEVGASAAGLGVTPADKALKLAKQLEVVFGEEREEVVLTAETGSYFVTYRLARVPILGSSGRVEESVYVLFNESAVYVVFRAQTMVELAELLINYLLLYENVRV